MVELLAGGPCGVDSLIFPGLVHTRPELDRTHGLSIVRSDEYPLARLSGGDPAHVVIEGAQRAWAEGTGCHGAEAA
jgi:hypothetical protein